MEGEKNLTQKIFKNFVNKLKNPVTILFYEVDIHIDTSVENLEKDLFNEEVLNIFEFTDKITILDKNSKLDFNKEDYLKYYNDEEKRQKVFVKKEVKEKKEVKLPEIKKYSIASGIRTEKEEIDKVQIFEGNEKEMLKWINDQLKLLTVETFFSNNKIVFCLEPAQEEKEWYTLEELINAGVFEVK